MTHAHTTPAHLAQRRERLAAQLALTDEILLVAAGEPLGIPGGADQTYPFLAHADFYYLAEHETPGAVIAFDPAMGPAKGWHDFVPIITNAQRIWENPTQAPGLPLAELPAFLAARRGRPVVSLGAALRAAPAPSPKTHEIRERFAHARRPKDEHELALLRRAAHATAAGFDAALTHATPGASERDVQIELEAAFFRAGATRAGYASIVGSGPNAAVLHSAPSHRTLNPGDLLLIDAGAEINRYTADVTRTYIVGGAAHADTARRELHDIVLRTLRNAVQRCRPNAEWIDLHLAAALDLTDGLVQMGLLSGSPTSLVEQEAHTLFFPHGLGHLVGLGVRDASGRLPGRAPSSRKGAPSIRMDLPLQPGYVTTVEPGLYLIPALLNDPDKRSTHATHTNWALADALAASGLGGVRIEDNVLITDNNPINLTAHIPADLNHH
ncbi:MAG: aminopeptidase P N-terminal domain-containing protein [Phycisphaeraceae bacterium]|nr:MAG: aminopeptidase P N-terminal domain-containing protein [Phycisphaeraceae bacterium]